MQDFAEVDCTTEWMRLRIEPLLKHSQSLEELGESTEFSKEFWRLRKGVKMFHSDLVYLRSNIIELKKILKSEQQGSSRTMR